MVQGLCEWGKGCVQPPDCKLAWRVRRQPVWASDAHTARAQQQQPLIIASDGLCCVELLRVGVGRSPSKEAQDPRAVRQVVGAEKEERAAAVIVPARSIGRKRVGSAEDPGDSAWSPRASVAEGAASGSAADPGTAARAAGAEGA